VVYAQCPLSARAALEERVRPDQRVVLAAHFNKSIADEWVGLLGLRKGRLYRRILARDREVIARLDGIVYVSEFARRIVETETPAATRVKSAVIPNFVSAAPDNSGAPAAGDLVTIGTLEPRKNHAYLLRVLAAARTRGKVYRLTIIGDGPSRPELEALAEQLGVAGQVRFLGVQPDARRLLKGHRVYVHSSLMESFGIVLIEAMAAGLPLCAAPTGGVPDVFDHGQEGFYWPLDDPDEGARLLMTLSEDADLRRRMSDAARRRFHRQFEVGAAAAGLLDFLGSIATGAPPRVVRET
jgi:glycosyltransferase involved in cell wall biosynthesis